MSDIQKHHILWTLALVITTASVAAIALISRTFAYEVDVAAAPVLEYTALQCLAGLAWLGLVIASVRFADRCGVVRISVVIGIGVALRLLMFDTHPILETDHFRYLWDGAVTAMGQNPYALSPDLVRSGDKTVAPAVIELGRTGGLVLERVNQPTLTTIYPLVAQGAFATAALINVFDLEAWRWLLFATEMLTLVLLLAALKEFSLPPILCTVYWLNPLVIKEVSNTTHVDGLLSPLLLVIAIAIARHRHGINLVALAFAAGVKLWPLMLMPFACRDRPAFIRGCIWVFVVCIVLLLPIILSADSAESGLFAYTTGWRVNSAGFSVITFLVDLIVGAETAELVARALVAVITVAIVLWLAARSGDDTVRRLDHLILAIAALLLLAPAVYPWYYLWLAVLVALRPRLSLLMLTVTLPLYYLRFYLAAIDQSWWFSHVVIWIEFAPVFVALAFELFQRRNVLHTP